MASIVMTDGMPRIMMDLEDPPAPYPIGDEPTIHPMSPNYSSPTSPVYPPESPEYSPTASPPSSPKTEPASPAYNSASPSYEQISPGYRSPSPSPPRALHTPAPKPTLKRRRVEQTIKIE